MNEIALYEIIRNGLTIATPAIQSVVTALITTLFLRGNTSTTEFEKLKAGKIGETIDDLVKSGKMTLFELYKCRNFLQVVKLADEAAKESTSEQNKHEDFDFDWFMRFFDAVGNISNEELQQLWSQILSSEISRPKSCSLRTLDIVRNMSPDEALTFTTLCKFVLKSADTHFIYAYGFHDLNDGYHDCNAFIKDLGLVYSNDIAKMLEIGTVSKDSDLALYLDNSLKLPIHNDKVFCFMENPSNETIFFKQDAYLLTSSGIELYNVVKNTSGFDVDIDYAILCFKEIRKEYPPVKLTAFKISTQDIELSLDDIIEI